MNKLKDKFTIQDFEILTGIKAHTIRIWEKRYNLLIPARINRNIRVYSLSDLQKILNVSLLYKNNYKISQIAKLSDALLSEEAKTVSLNDFSNNYEINSLLLCMYTFDENLFQKTYLKLLKKVTFIEIFSNTYIPLLNHLGLLWQTDSIKPAHEHFISNLIYQKIAINIAALPNIERTNGPVNVLFLPFGEIHELGLFFLNYYLKLKGERTVYLGKSIPFDNLFYVNSQIKSITWITYFMIDSTAVEKKMFLDNGEKLVAHTKNKCIIVGKVWEEFSKENKNEQIIFKTGLEQLILNKEETMKS
jgi:DNA-binding transcriptional MerR regulator